MPTDMNKYPPDWPQRRKRILKRANYECEQCGFQDREHIWSVKIYGTGKRKWVRNKEVARKMVLDSGWGKKIYENPGPVIKRVKVILTIAHLDHDETNWDVKDERLMALCQKCHLVYDAQEKTKRVLGKK